MTNIPIYQRIPLSVSNLTCPISDSLFSTQSPVLLLLAAGKGTRFGTEPKCIQPILGTPIARHSINAFRKLFPGAPVICIIGYKHDEVQAALKDPSNNNHPDRTVFILSGNPVGGTAWAVYEGFSVPNLLQNNPNIVISMGDRIVPESIFQQILSIHTGNGKTTEAALTLLTAEYERPKNIGKGRIVRDKDGRILRIIEQKDILQIDNTLVRESLHQLTEGNCPLYVLRARTLMKYLMILSDNNAQNQYYLTDIIETMARDKEEIRSFTITPSVPEYAVLCSDMTRQEDRGRLETAMNTYLLKNQEAETAANIIRQGRSAGQTASIKRQLRELLRSVQKGTLSFDLEQPVAIGITGGRFRIAFMHPDMGRFFGPAWQMPIGSASEEEDAQLVVLLQEGTDHRVHLLPMNPLFQETTNSVNADISEMYPGNNVTDWYSYEEFGTRMSERLLLSLGYFSDDELDLRRKKGLPIPPQSLWVRNNMRRPFSLVGNAIASLRTCQSGHLGEKIQKYLGKEKFPGLKVISTGDLPRGGFSSSSALTLAVKNALNALFKLEISPDQLIDLACQAEYGTGVRAGSLDQATEQKGECNIGTLISSNPADHYAILGRYPVPQTFQTIFPYTVDRDREAPLWSGGFYSNSILSGSTEGILTTTETRKMTGKAAEIAAILVELPLDRDFFKFVQEDLLDDGILSVPNRRWIANLLLQIPLCISKEELRTRIFQKSDFYRSELVRVKHLTPKEAEEKTESTFRSLFDGWRCPLFLYSSKTNEKTTLKPGVPLRAMVAYLFAEVAKNCYLIHHQNQWIEMITRSQKGDRCFTIPISNLPERKAMESILPWEENTQGPDRLNLWLKKMEAVPFDFNKGLDDNTLTAEQPPEFHLIEGTNFFRGLALIDLAEAMLKRAFGRETTAVRVNAAGQGDFFQVHIDTTLINPEEVREFLRKAFYRRFNLVVNEEFVEIHPGGGAVGIRLDRTAALEKLIDIL